MPESRTTSTTAGEYRYTVGGEAFGIPHEAGDKVPSSIPDAKLREWLRAGTITKRVNPAKGKK